MSRIVAITVQTRDGLSSIMDSRFGRAKAYIFVDPDSGEIISEMGNVNTNAAHGAGTGAAAMMKAQRVDAVISGRFGPKAFQSLDTFQIEMWSAPEGLSAEEALMQYKAGMLQRISGATNPGHSNNNVEGRGGGMGGGRGMGGGGMGGGRGMGGGGMGGGGMGGGRGMGGGGMGGGGKGSGRNR